MKRVITVFILSISTFFSQAGNSEVFPNPTTNKFVINSNLQVKSIEVYNFLGTKIVSSYFEIYNHQEIDISALSSGRYFVKVTYNNGDTPEIIQLVKK